MNYNNNNNKEKENKTKVRISNKQKGMKSVSNVMTPSYQHEDYHR